ncbi:hypothetical protein ABIF69_009104 [Bradyrhizobium japonicum]
MPIVQFTRFKTDKPEEMIKIVRQAKKIFEKHGAEFLRPHWPVGRRVAGCDALFQLGSLRQSAGSRGKRPGVRASAG